jgi:1,4-dihydroxy-2-naphthoyl-CoA synthase
MKEKVPTRVGTFFVSRDLLHLRGLLGTLITHMTPLADYTRIKYEINRRVCTITLSRPEKHNALDDLMISELTSAFQSAQRDNEVKVIVLKAEGESFCSGADLEYLQKISRYDFNQNQEDSNTLMRLFLHIYSQRKPVACAPLAADVCPAVRAR